MVQMKGRQQKEMGASCNFPHAWHGWTSCSHFWKFTRWRFICGDLLHLLPYVEKRDLVEMIKLRILKSWAIQWLGARGPLRGKQEVRSQSWTCDGRNSIQQGHKPKNAGALRSWKSQGNGYYPSAFRRSTALPPIKNSKHHNCKRINLWCSKPLKMWSFITIADFPDSSVLKHPPVMQET